LITGEAFINDRSVSVEAEVVYTLSGDCTRCTDSASKEIVVGIDEVFFDREEDDVYTYKNDKLDLTKALIDAIILSMPSQLLCSDDCKGICLNCGANLNRESCKCQKV
jgi:uncharacterized protein